MWGTKVIQPYLRFYFFRYLVVPRWSFLGIAQKQSIKQRKQYRNKGLADLSATRKGPKRGGGALPSKWAIYRFDLLSVLESVSLMRIDDGEAPGDGIYIYIYTYIYIYRWMATDLNLSYLHILQTLLPDVFGLKEGPKHLPRLWPNFCCFKSEWVLQIHFPLLNSYLSFKVSLF